MVGLHNITMFRLADLPYQTKELLSRLLNTPKIIPSDGPDKLRRDCFGLAHLVEIPHIVVANFPENIDKTARILDIWIHEKPETATLNKLLEFLQRLDRYDVHDDILSSLKEYVDRGELIVNRPSQIAVKTNINVIPPSDDEYDVITYDDKPNEPQYYDAFILYVEADASFVVMLHEKLGHKYKFCTRDKLLVGHATQYAPVAQLLSQRCRHIILVYSPDFVTNSTNCFYTDYAQAVSIESQNYSSKRRKIIPVVYRDCRLPVNLVYYHKLYYQKDPRSMYDFWEKLDQSLNPMDTMPIRRLNGSTSALSALNIEEITNGQAYDSSLFLPPYKSAMTSVSMNQLDFLKVDTRDGDMGEDKSISGSSQLSVNIEQTKKKRTIKQTIKKIFRTKSKKTEPQLVSATI